MQIYDIAIAPGQPRYIDAQGDYFYFYAGNAGGADTSIRLQGRSSGLQIMLMPGQSYKLPPGTRETTWILTNRVGEGTIFGSVIIGMGGIDDNRITGSVEVIDGGKARTMANQAFFASDGITSDAASQPGVYLQNPVGSGKNVIVKSVRASVTVTGGWLLGWATGTTGLDRSISVVPKANAGTYKTKLFTSATGALLTPTSPIVSAYLAANQIDSITFNEPLVMRPGSQILAYSTTLACAIRAGFEGFEEPI